MRRAVAIAFLSMVAAANPARAEFPAAGSAWVGLGTGYGQREELRDSGTFGLAGLDAAWRFAAGRAIVLTYEGAGGPTGVTYIPESPHFVDLDFQAVTAGPEFSAPSGECVEVFCRCAIGAGLVTSDAVRGMRYDGVWMPPLATLRETGFAISGGLGLRVVIPPGPVGFTLALRGAQVYGRHSSAGARGVAFGVTLYPLDRRRATPAAH